MIEESLIRSAKEFIEARLLQTRKKFELVLGSTRDIKKKSEIESAIDNVNRDIKKLQADLFTEADLTRYKIEREDLEDYADGSVEHKGSYKILRNIAVIPMNKFSKNTEINSIWSYLNFFSTEYMGFLSEQNLKLDYGHAYQRDKFYNAFNECFRFLESYSEILEQLNNAGSSGGKEYKERLVSLQSKQYRDIIVKVGRFLRSVNAFIDDILESEQNGEKVLLEPDKIVEIHGQNSNLEGVTARQALMDLQEFIEEFIDYMKIPDLKKLDEDEDL